MTDLNWSELWDEDEQRYRVKTRDGLEVRLWTISANCEPHVRGEINTGNGFVTGTWNRSGRYVDNKPGADLVPEPRTVRRWVNVYQDYSIIGNRRLSGLYDSEVEARDSAATNFKRIATVHVEWEE